VRWRSDHNDVSFGLVVDVAGTDVLVVAGTVVVDVVVVEVADVVDVVDAGGLVVDVVVGVDDTPLMTPSTVVPDFGPPKIEERERPALTSTTVTTPKARANAATAEAVATRDRRQRLCDAARSA
jgi:hypothetical protein